MFRVERSIVINEEITKVWQIASNINNWHEIFPRCRDIKILAREGNKTIFEVTVRSIGNLPIKWRVSRVVDEVAKTMTSKRERPKFPLRVLINERTFEEIMKKDQENVTKVTLISNFDISVPVVGWLIGKYIVAKLIQRIVGIEQETLKKMSEENKLLGRF